MPSSAERIVERRERYRREGRCVSCGKKAGEYEKCGHCREVAASSLRKRRKRAELERLGV